MERTQSTGWRAPSPPVSHVKLRTAEKTALFEACRRAVQALQLKPATRHVLQELCSFYRGEQISDMMLVWPSNDMLEGRTGLSERSIRYALRDLLQLGVIGARESANGKRYARRSRAGQIIDAYGFDLTPLLGRADEWKQRVEAQKDLEREKRAQLAEITICRRMCQEWLINAPDEVLEAKFDQLCRLVPRSWRSTALPEALELWNMLKGAVEAHYTAACGGKDCRQKDTNNDTSEQSCQQGTEEVGVGLRSVELTDLVEACPSVWRWGKTPTTIRDLVAEAGGELRGAIGIHPSAWREAVEAIGPVAAAAALALVMQQDIDGQKSGVIIKSPGGYYRNYVRKVAAGQIRLEVEIERFKKKRRH